MNKKILIVEDDEFLLDFMTHRISIAEENFEAIQAKDGKEALEKLHQHKIDLVLLDLVMPGKNGFEFLKEMRENTAFENIPVIVLSNLSQQEQIDQCLSLGIADYLIKAHFTPSEVVKKIGKVLGLSSSKTDGGAL